MEDGRRDDQAGSGLGTGVDLQLVDVDAEGDLRCRVQTDAGPQQLCRRGRGVDQRFVEALLPEVVGRRAAQRQRQ